MCLVLWQVYICGGFSGRECLFTAECFDPKTNQWTVIAPMISRRSGVRVAAYGSQVYAVSVNTHTQIWMYGCDLNQQRFGQVGGFDGMSRLRSVEAYNPQTNTWHSVQSMNQPRSNFGIEVRWFNLCWLSILEMFSWLRWTVILISRCWMVGFLQSGALMAQARSLRWSVMTGRQTHGKGHEHRMSPVISHCMTN